MAKKGRPFTYQSDEERPVTISLRLAHDLYDRLERYAQRHRQSVSELVRDGIEMRLATQADPRWQTAPEQETYYDNTVLQELATPAHLLDDRIPFDDEYRPVPVPATPAVSDMSYDNNTVIHKPVPKRRDGKGQAAAVQQDQTPALAQDHAPVTKTPNGTTVMQEAESKHRGRKPVLREPILALLREHQAGLTAAQLKVYLDTEKPIGDTLSGMVKAALLVKDGNGKAVRYLLADAGETSSRP